MNEAPGPSPPPNRADCAPACVVPAELSARIAGRRPGSITTRLNVTLCDWFCSWRTRRPPAPATVPVAGQAVKDAPDE
jgi:hypothetical protein